MPHYSPERKDAILQKMAPPHCMTVAELARQEGMSEATLYNWRNAARKTGAILPSYSNPPDNWSSEEKFRAVLQTATLSEAEISEFCRKQGLYPEQIEAWRRACMAANSHADAQDKRSLAARKTDKKRIKVLETELNRKNAALAETAALLALSKKAEAIWGISREDD